MTTTPPLVRPTSFLCIEGLRAWMAWWVVLGHAIQLCGLPFEVPAPVLKLLLMGDVAVNVFIIVSGFVITHLLLGRSEPYGRYITRRAFRIVPIYVLCTVIAVATAGWYRTVFVDVPWASDAAMRLDRLASEDASWWAHVLAHATLLHGAIPEWVLPYAGSALLGPAWSLSLEWQFYLVAPFLILLLGAGNAKRFQWFTVALAASLAAALLLRGAYQYPSMLLLSGKFFLLGIASRMLIEECRPLNLGVDLAMAAALVLALCSRSVELVVWAPFFVAAVAQAKLLQPASQPLQRAIDLVATHRVARHLGKISYSTYLIHVPLFAALGSAWKSLFGLESAGDLQWVVLLSILVLPWISGLLYGYVEAPFIAFGKKFELAWLAQPQEKRA